MNFLLREILFFRRHKSVKNVFVLIIFFAFSGLLQACGVSIASSASISGMLPITEALPSQIVAKVNLTTAGPVDSKDSYVSGRIEIDPNGIDPSWALSKNMQIKGRGNSTWELPKKPYKIKLNSAASLMGMPSDKEWVLLAHYSDKTLMRTMVANEMSRRLGMAYTPRGQVIELNLNGKNLGTYMLTEQIKVSADRVNVGTGDITGGYVLELDQRQDSSYQFVTRLDVPYSIREPSTPTTAQQNYIKNYIQNTEDVLNSAGFDKPVSGYAAYIDIDSFINWYLINEVLKNSDASSYASIYFHKASGEKLKMGPVWDFDTAIGNNNYTDAEYPTGWWIRTDSPWFARLFEDPAFAAKVKVRWNQMTAQSTDLNSMLQVIDSYAYVLDQTQQVNFEVWDILGEYVWPNRVVMGTYPGEVRAMKEWLTIRMKWMDSQFNGSRV